MCISQWSEAINDDDHDDSADLNAVAFQQLF